MTRNVMRSWIWLQENVLYKAVYNPATCTLVLYNQHDEILLRRAGISIQQLASLEALFQQLGAKRLDGHKEPFTYL